ncbi:hypothetical protein PV325_011991 [Microctonus aethiopoides]|uniref:C2H2-type domain-containing protein n=1 Tax=Microctonus aethiopoides TaxID=144406 RepID=A0AA39KK65_9HYME|nr:hypothetical protein PV325_011991 [Microctonus aethiopoides]KAK0164469.1 hypothetical protein PV328_003093 [Microctonus aethiopoides]
MDRQKELLNLCKPLFIKLTRVSHSDYHKWKQGTSQVERPHYRRRHAWRRGDCRSSTSVRNQRIKKRSAKYILSDSDDELSESHTFNDNANDTILSKCERTNESDITVQNTQIQVIDNSIVLPKNNMPITDKVAWKYKRKRQRTSQSTSNELVQENENIETSNTIQPNNLDNENENETTQVDLSKEIKIVSSRLEDSDDPQVEKWRSKKKALSLPKSRSRLLPKSNSLNCTVCSIVFENKEELSNHIFKHTQRELQDAYKAAKTKLRESESNVDAGNISDEFDDCDESTSKLNQSTISESHAHNDTSKIIQPIPSSLITTSTQASETVPMVICSCHTERYPQNDASVQIEMVLYCETCHVLFRRSECFETHYRFSAKCNADRSKGRSPKLFCSTCRIILNTLSNMRRHLQEHASINFHGTVTFVCNICRVVFFGVGTVFCTHWFNHEKDPTFVASRYSFPKLCISTQGTKPAGSGPDEQYVFVAEYVCRLCKLQFSSESELTDHTENNCNNGSSDVQVQNKSLSDAKSAINNLKSKLKSTTNRAKKDSSSSNILDMVNNWICEFCNGSYSSRSAFEEHSTKHLQEDGYPGYSCVFQMNASTAFLCNICRRIYDNLSDLIKHWVTHEVIKFICTACNEKCSSYASFETHISLGCWKSKPDCRVWFNRQQHVCKICKSMFKTAEELVHHYKFEHGAAIETNNTKNPPSKSLPFMETPPVSETSTSPHSKKNESSKITSADLPPNLETLSASGNSSNSSYPQNSAVIINTQAVDSDIENAVSKEPPLQKLRTIKITIPNLVSSGEKYGNNDQITLNNNLQNGISEIYQSTNATVSVDSLNKQITNITNSPLIESSVNNQPLNLKESSTRIVIRDSCIHSSKLIIADTIPNKNIDDNNRSARINIGNSQILLSIIPTSANSSPQVITLSNNIPMVPNESDSNSGSDAVEIIENSKISEKVNKIPDKVVEMNENDELDIIEIPNNSNGLTSDTFVQNQNIKEPEVIQLENCKLNGSESTHSSSNSRRNHQPNTSNSENIRPVASETTNENNQCSNSTDTSMPRGFLRVKKFTELQAIRNYVCNQCGAAFDNVKSLEEHIVAHTRRLTGNEKHPTMMAALILPQVEPDHIEKVDSTPTVLSSVPQIGGKRILPPIPQRVTNADARKASPLVHGQVVNKIYNAQVTPPTQNVSNLVILPQIDSQANQSFYTCPLCLVFRCENSEEFKNHLTTNHYNNIAPNINSSFNNSNTTQSVLNETSKEKQKVYTCKVCKYNTTNRTMIIEHIQYFHLSEFPQATNNNIPRSSEAIQQADYTTPVNNLIPSSIPPFKCSLCTNYQYNSLEELSRHFQTVHQFPQKDIYHPFICNICFHLFKTYSELIIHLNQHQNSGWT